MTEKTQAFPIELDRKSYCKDPVDPPEPPDEWRTALAERPLLALSETLHQLSVALDELRSHLHAFDLRQRDRLDEIEW